MSNIPWKATIKEDTKLLVLHINIYMDAIQSIQQQ